MVNVLKINKLLLLSIHSLHSITYSNFKFIIYLVLLISLLTSCITYKKSVLGEYKSEKFGKLYSSFLRMNHTAVISGTSLFLAQDSTFIENNCGNIMKGKFKVFNDSLYLFCQQNRYKNDSINSIKKLDCYNKPMVFSISGNKLTSSIILKEDDRKALIYLVKVRK